jgi:hypothetical protein
MKVADILWEAANEHLRSENEDAPEEGWLGCLFSCDAVSSSARAGGGDQADHWRGGDAVLAWLETIGLPEGHVHMHHLFDDFERGEVRQGVRYMWLLLAMHVAEDEGLSLQLTGMLTP